MLAIKVAYENFDSGFPLVNNSNNLDKELMSRYVGAINALG